MTVEQLSAILNSVCLFVLDMFRAFIDYAQTCGC
jgi:hypothetical protein